MTSCIWSGRSSGCSERKHFTCDRTVLVRMRLIMMRVACRHLVDNCRIQPAIRLGRMRIGSLRCRHLGCWLGQSRLGSIHVGQELPLLLRHALRQLHLLGCIRTGQCRIMHGGTKILSPRSPRTGRLNQVENLIDRFAFAVRCTAQGAHFVGPVDAARIDEVETHVVKSSTVPFGELGVESAERSRIHLLDSQTCILGRG